MLVTKDYVGVVNMKYSAAFTKEGWFEREIQTVLELKLEGLDQKQILDKVIDQNLFQMRSVEGIKTRFQMVYRRVNTFDDTLWNHFLSSSIYDKKALILYSYIKTYRVPYEFFMEVIVSNYNQNKTSIQREDFDYFFEVKETQVNIVRDWRPQTKVRLIRSMVLFFRESGLITEIEKGVYSINPLHISKNLNDYANHNDKLLLLMATLNLK